jgi:hypothetical protein
MKTFDAMKKLGLGLALTGLCVWQAGATVQYYVGEYSTPQYPAAGDIHSSPSGYLLGNIFSTTSLLPITALGAYTFGNFASVNGFGTGVTVGLYQLEGLTWTELVSATFTGKNYTFQNSYAYQPVNLTLAAEETYAIVAAGYGGGTPVHLYTTGDTTFNGIYGTTQGGVFGNGVTLSGSSLPSSFNVGDAGVSYNGYTYGAGTFAAVPEAADFALAAVALLGLVYVGRLYSQKLKLA